MHITAPIYVDQVYFRHVKLDTLASSIRLPEHTFGAVKKVIGERLCFL